MEDAFGSFMCLDKQGKPIGRVYLTIEEITAKKGRVNE